MWAVRNMQEFRTLVIQGLGPVRFFLYIIYTYTHTHFFFVGCSMLLFPYWANYTAFWKLLRQSKL